MEQKSSSGSCWPAKLGWWCFAVAFFIMLSEGLASATIIRLSTTTNVTVDAANSQIHFVIEVENNGDEAAHDVQVSFARLAKSIKLAKAIAPNDHAEVTIDFSFSDLAIKEEGVYLFPFHIVYKDGNQYPFSAIATGRVEIGTLPAETLRAKIVDAGAGTPIELQGHRRVEVVVSNTGRDPVVLQEIEPLLSLELRPHTPELDLPHEVKGYEDFFFPLDMENLSGLPDSLYSSAILVGGTSQGKHIAEQMPFQVLVKAAPPRPLKAYRYLAVMVLLITAFALYVRKKMNTPPPV